MLRPRKTIVTAAALIALAMMGSAGAANSQQDKMKTCNAQASAKSLKGDDRKQFMSTCLSSASASATGNSQQEKMKTCNAQASAKSLKGDDRKQFMSTCLKGS